MYSEYFSPSSISRDDDSGILCHVRRRGTGAGAREAAAWGLHDAPHPHALWTSASLKSRLSNIPCLRSVAYTTGSHSSTASVGLGIHSCNQYSGDSTAPRLHFQTFGTENTSLPNPVEPRRRGSVQHKVRGLCRMVMLARAVGMLASAANLEIMARTSLFEAQIWPD
ncbi:hypothetical protein P154DRAFT_534993 [Amniculicola lignicola CBS 123094]|uniref:Uncharacterized protein n=1 Tax=Amniculicola lignicola CBS 123094 TaxID=1392246 RepID=A0A6A5WEZ6_9PLEO|nr:hypothetical protein P154DRAFT_534993 [Amniculicola lignicola CBS 123094]